MIIYHSYYYNIYISLCSVTLNLEVSFVIAHPSSIEASRLEAKKEGFRQSLHACKVMPSSERARMNGTPVEFMIRSFGQCPSCPHASYCASTHKLVSSNAPVSVRTHISRVLDERGPTYSTVAGPRPGLPSDSSPRNEQVTFSGMALSMGSKDTFFFSSFCLEARLESTSECAPRLGLFSSRPLVMDRSDKKQLTVRPLQAHQYRVGLLISCFQAMHFLAEAMRLCVYKHQSLSP